MFDLTKPQSAVLSSDRRYRYTLTRVWDFDNPKFVQIIGLNPSTADETTDDATIRRCIAFGKKWGMGGMVMTNLFSYRATDPADMKRQANPVGYENDSYLLNVARKADLIVCAWGTHGSHWGRGKFVSLLLSREAQGKSLMCFGVTGNGNPKHPLYLRSDSELVEFCP